MGSSVKMSTPSDGALRVFRHGFSALAELLIVSLSFIIFSMFNLLDRILCIAFWALDYLLDPGCTPCYCKQRVNGALPEIRGPTLLSAQSLLLGEGARGGESAGGSLSTTGVARRTESSLETIRTNGSISSGPSTAACYGTHSSSAMAVYDSDDQHSHGKRLLDSPVQANLFARNGISVFSVLQSFAADAANHKDGSANHALASCGDEQLPLDVKNAGLNNNRRLSIQHLHTADNNHQSSLPQKMHASLQAVWSKVLAGEYNLLSPFQTKHHFSRAMTSRWSDCSCSTCTSWQADEKESLYVHVEGEGHENIIFIHGFLSSSLLWSEKIIPYLSNRARNKYRLFAVDLLGFGKSPKPRSCHYTMADHIKKVEECVLHRYKITSFHLVAHSMGCLVALALGAAHVDSVKTITLLAPPYFPAPANDVGALHVLQQVAPRRIWPLTAFGASVMSWYEHVGRGVCFVLCKQHIMWECVLSFLTLNRISRAAVRDFMQHTHHSAWHIFHNVICGEAFAMDGYLGKLEKAGCIIHILHGKNDVVVPVKCSYQLQSRYPTLHLQVLEGVNHFTIIYGREQLFSDTLERIWKTEGLI